MVTDNGEYAEKIAVLRNHGQKEKYHHLMKGSNSRLDTLQAAVLRVKLKHLKEWNELRRRNARTYNRLLQGIGVEGPAEEAYAEHVYHLFVIAVNDRDGLQKYLSQNGIETGIHYPIPIHEQEAYREIRPSNHRYPVTEELAKTILSLPFYPELTEDQIQYVVEMIRRFHER